MISVLINNIESNSLIDWQSLIIDQNKDEQVDTCRFKVYVYTGKAFNPAYNQEVVVFNNGDKVFAGKIQRIKQNIDSVKDVIVYDIECTDYTSQLSGILVTRTYLNKTVKEILVDLCDQFAPSFNADNVFSDYVMPKIVFNQVYFSDCIKKMAGILNYFYYVDYEKSIHFFNGSEGNSPFQITDDGGYEFASLEKILDGSQIVNRVKVRGGEYDGNAITDKITVAGSNSKIFSIPQKLSNLTIKLNGVTKTVGIDNIDEFTSFDVLYNYQEKSIKWQNVLTNGDVIEYSGNPKIRVFAIAEDIGSIGQYGAIEKLIREDDIKSIEIARKRASAELFAYSNGVIDAVFLTRQTGLRVGQSVQIDCPSRSLKETLTIKAIQFTTIDPFTFQYKVSLINSNRANLLSILSKLLTPATLDINENEVDEQITLEIGDLRISEEHLVIGAIPDDGDLEINETHYLNPLGVGVEPTWVLADYFPTSETDPKRQGRLGISMKLY